MSNDGSNGGFVGYDQTQWVGNGGRRAWYTYACKNKEDKEGVRNPEAYLTCLHTNSEKHRYCILSAANPDDMVTQPATSTTPEKPALELHYVYSMQTDYIVASTNWGSTTQPSYQYLKLLKSAVSHACDIGFSKPTMRRDTQIVRQLIGDCDKWTVLSTITRKYSSFRQACHLKKNLEDAINKNQVCT